MKKKITGLLVITLSSMMLTACGSTVQENTKDYLENTGTIVKQLFSNDEEKIKEKMERMVIAETETNKIALEAPENFTVDKTGNYSFDAVEGAQYYLIYLCAPDAVSDTDTFLYCSDQITEDGSSNYTGNLSELMKYGYGEYLVKCYAFPDLMDDEHRVSVASTGEFETFGEQSAPEIFYYWDTYSEKMGMQIGNMDVYEFEEYPQKVTITFTNVEDSSEQVVLDIQDINEENYNIETTELKKGTTYKVTATAYNESEFVTNTVSDTTVVAEAMTIGESNLFTYGYEYSDGFDRNLFNWAFVGENFNPEEGGVCGITTAYSFAAYAPGRRDFEIVATPKDPVDGAMYSYDGVVELVYQALDNEVIGAVSKLQIELNLYEDGTLAASATGCGGIVASAIKGNWVENSDGTLTLSFDHSSIEK